MTRSLIGTDERTTLQQTVAAPGDIHRLAILWSAVDELTSSRISPATRRVALMVAVVFSLALHCFALASLTLFSVPTSACPSQVLGIQAELIERAEVKSALLLEAKPEEAESPGVDLLRPIDVADSLAVLEVPAIELPAVNHEEFVPDTSRVSARALDPTQLLTSASGFAYGAMEGRLNPLRTRLVEAGGGSPESELAMERGLQWLVAHQSTDGGWRFDHRAACGHGCRDAGHHGSTTAATALGLLPLLASGSTHQYGEHQQAAAQAVSYLRSRMIETPYGGDLQEGDMYGQGLATLALCEALAMTGDEGLRRSCQLAVDFIVFAQNDYGGWRYFPRQPGDTTVWGWQVAALTAAQKAGIDIPPATLQRAQGFLNGVQSDEGAAYGYQSPDAKPTTTAIGLLGGIQLGRRRSDSGLQRGAALLDAWGPSSDDVYFNFYATQVLHHYDGRHWDRWNAQMRDQLIDAQASSGHEAGSWYFADSHTLAGGRLCDTSLAVMILQVYYRHLHADGPQGSPAPR